MQISHFTYYKYSGEDPQPLTCKKVPSPSSIHEMSTLKFLTTPAGRTESPLHTHIVLHELHVIYMHAKYQKPSPYIKRDMSTLKFF